MEHIARLDADTPRPPMLMQPTQHEKNEWARLAQHAYAYNHNAVGHKYSGAASLPKEGAITLAYFDALQAGYREWLIRGSLTAAYEA
jgi:hypothetical protein